MLLMKQLKNASECHQLIMQLHCFHS